MIIFVFFFFQAEDGIRDFHVTGVQTCALPISATISSTRIGLRNSAENWASSKASSVAEIPPSNVGQGLVSSRSHLPLVSSRAMANTPCAIVAQRSPARPRDGQM